MHKDPPPSFFERPLRRLIVEGLVVGLISSTVFFGASLVANSSQGLLSQERMPVLKDQK
jgi:hypothetical protein